jgi:hypothetical protein
MACRTIMTGPGTFAIACGPRQKPKPCSVPHCGRPGAFLCDHPVSHKVSGTGKCEAPICLQHATRTAYEHDLCPAHSKAEANR